MGNMIANDPSEWREKPNIYDRPQENIEVSILRALGIPVDDLPVTSATIELSSKHMGEVRVVLNCNVTDNKGKVVTALNEYTGDIEVVTERIDYEVKKGSGKSEG